MSLSGCSQLWKVRIGRNIGQQEWVSLCQGILSSCPCFCRIKSGQTHANLEGEGHESNYFIKYQLIHSYNPHPGVQSRGYGGLHRVGQVRHDPENIR